MLHTDGNFYGVTEHGGAAGYGTVYRLSPSGAVTTLVQFTGFGGATPGQSPRGTLVANGEDTLWGTSYSGSSSGQGIVFKYTLSTKTFSTLAQFFGAGANRGDHPYGGLVSDGAGSFWGTTFQGGSTSNGVIFKINSTTGALTVVTDFTGSAGAAIGSLAQGRLVADAVGFLWGTTQQGGAGNFGTVFKVNRTTGAVTSVAAFTGTVGAARGEDPLAGLVSDDAGYFWGTTASGGTGFGTVFKVNAVTGAVTTVVSFTGSAGAAKGSSPVCDLVSDNLGNFWGTTASGGTGNYGTIFKVNAGTNALTTVAEFTDTGAIKGYNPQTGLIPDGAGSLWGTTYSGGLRGAGTAFKVNIGTGALTTVCEFGASQPAHPVGALVADAAGSLWGTTDEGGFSVGTVYKVDPSTGDITTMATMTGDGAGLSGSYPYAGVVSDGNGFFWGTAHQGGSNSNGTIFKVNAATGALTTVVNFTNNTGAFIGRNPHATLVPDGAGFFWGTTLTGGASGPGTVFKLNIATGALTPMVQFTGISGAAKGTRPRAAVCQDGAGFFWGTTSQGGTANLGTIYKVNATTGVMSTVVEFTGTTGAALGSTPTCVLVNDGAGFLWGTTGGGGINNFGTVFKVNAATGAMTTAIEFTGAAGAAKGQVPYAGLTSDGYGGFYGTTFAGGSTGFGTIFRITQDGNFTTVFEFTDTSGAVLGKWPSFGGLLRHTDGHMYGATSAGGLTLGGALPARGEIFRLRFGPDPFTQLPTPIGSGSATLKGTMNPNGAVTNVSFLLATNPALTGAQMLSVGTTSAGTSPESFSQPVANLVPSTTYYYRIIGLSTENPNAQLGGIQSFSTAANTAPKVILVGANPLIMEAAISYADPGAGVADIEETALVPTLTSNGVVPNVVGNYSATWSVTDSYGLSANAVRTVQVIDTTAPAVDFHADVVVEATGPTGAIVTYTAATASDIVGVTSLTYSQNSGSLFPIGSTVATITARDGANNVGTRTFTVTVRDTVNPIVDIHPNVTAEATAANGAAVIFDPAVAADTVGVVSVAYSQNSGTVFPIGTTPVIITAKDAANNVGTQTFFVTVSDTTAPAISPHAAVTVEATSAAGAIANYEAATVSDAVGVVSVSYTQNTGTLFPIGVTPITITARDAANNVSTLVFSVTVRDTTAPQMLIPPPLIVEASNAAGAIVNFNIPVADAVDSAPVVIATPASGSVFPLGTTTVIVTATDATGNQRAGSFNVTVRDTTSPVIAGAFSPLVLVTDSAGSVALPNYVPQTVSTDAVGVVNVAQSPAPGSLRVAGTTAVTITSSDDAGNSQSVNFDVAVTDGTSPSISTPLGGFAPLTLAAGPSGTAPLPDYSGAAIVGDNVGVISVTQTPLAGSPRAPGITTVTLTAADAIGNVRGLDFAITVVDSSAPAIGSPAGDFSPLSLTTGVNGTVPLPDYTAQAIRSDNVGVTSVTQSPLPGSPRIAGLTPVTITATDAAGNSGNVDFLVEVADGTKPSIAAPPGNFTPLTLTSDAAGNAPLPDYTTQAITSDNVAVVSTVQTPSPGDIRSFGKTPVTLTTADAAGNNSSLTFDVFVALPLPLTRLIMATGQGVPGAGVDGRIPSDAVFTGFGVPAISNEGEVVFSAKWKSAAGVGEGIFAGAPMALVVAIGDAVPGVTGAQFKTFQDPVISPVGNLAFGATMQGETITPKTDSGVWMNSGVGLSLALREGSPVDGLKLKTISTISLRDGELLASAMLATAKGAATNADDEVVLRVTGTGSSIVLREGTPMDFADGRPASPVKTITLFAPANGSSGHGRAHADDGAAMRVTLADKRAAIIHVAADGSVAVSLGSGDAAEALGNTVFWETLGTPAVGTSGGVTVIKAGLKDGARTPALSKKNDTVLALDSGNGFAIFAREGNTAAGLSDANYASFLDPICNDRGRVAFIATLAGASVKPKTKTGLWWGDSDAPELIARAGNFAPDSSGLPSPATWKNFLSVALPDGAAAGPVILASIGGSGVSAKNGIGLWAVDGTGTLRQLLRTGDIVGGSPITGITVLASVPGSIGASRGYNAFGSVIVRVQFARGAQSILRIDIPPGSKP